MNFLMMMWLITLFAAPILVINQVAKGVRMTWRELGFFGFGLFIAGIPFLYILFQ